MQDTCRRFLAIAIGALLLGGCVWFNAGSSFNRKDLASKADALRMTSRTRAEVHAMLGEPWIASERWRVEVYRSTGKHWVVVIPDFLVPFPVASNITGYTLVSYSATGGVDAVGTGLAEDRRGDCHVDIQAGDFTFVDQCGGIYRYTAQALIVSRDRVPGTYGAPDANTCVVFVHCPGSCARPDNSSVGSLFTLGLQVDDDDGPRILINGFSGVNRFPLVPAIVGVGQHTLRLRGHDSAVPNDIDLGEISSPFVCPASTILYAVPLPTLSKASWVPFSRQHLGGTIRVQGDAPADLGDPGVMLWNNGRWLLPAGSQ